jgi:hypothetical protein
MVSKVKVDAIESTTGSGTIALNNQLSGMTVASLPTLTTTEMPAGSVIQVVQGTYSSTNTSTSSTLADTGLTATITPTSASNKIKVTVHQNGLGKDTNNTRVGIALLRGSTTIAWVCAHACFTGDTSTSFAASASGTYLDTPATTSAVTYKTQIKSYANNANVYAQLGGPTSTITLEEIKG